MNSREQRPANHVTASTAAAQALLQWRVHLARRRPGATAVLAGILAASMAVAYAVFAHPLPVAVTVGALFVSVSEFVLPVTYQVTAEGVSRATLLGDTFLPWKAVRRFEADAQAIRLFTLARPSQLDPFRGMTLRLPADAELRARLLDRVRVYLAQADPGRRSG